MGMRLEHPRPGLLWLAIPLPVGVRTPIKIAARPQTIRGADKKKEHSSEVSCGCCQMSELGFSAEDGPMEVSVVSPGSREAVRRWARAWIMANKDGKISNVA